MHIEFQNFELKSEVQLLSTQLLKNPSISFVIFWKNQPNNKQISYATQNWEDALTKVFHG